MPKMEVTSAPWAPVPARACTGKAPRARQHRAVGRLSTQRLRLQRTCRGDLSVDRRDRPDPVEHVPIPPAAPTACLDPFGSWRAPAAEELTPASAAK